MIPSTYLLVGALAGIQSVMSQSTATIYNPLQGQSSTAVGQAIESRYGSSHLAYTVHNTVPNMFGPHNFDPNNTNSYIRSRAYLAIPPAAIAALVLFVGLVYMIVRACSRTPVTEEKIIQPYTNTAGVNSGVYNDRLNALGTGGGTLRFTSWFSYITSLLLLLCCAGLAGATLYFNQQGHSNAITVEQYSTQIFTDSINFVNNIGSTYTAIQPQATSVAQSIQSYQYIGNDTDYYVTRFEDGRYPATIVIMALVCLSFVLLVLITPILCTRSPFSRSPSSPLLTITSILIWITAVLSWLLLAVYLIVLKVDSDVCVYADSYESNIETTPLFNSPTLSSIAATCLLDQNPLPAFSSSISGSESCTFLANDYYSLKSSLCRSNGLIDSYSYITLFVFIIAVLMTVSAMTTESIAHKARIIKSYLYTQSPAVSNTTVLNQHHQYATHANYIPEPTQTGYTNNDMNYSSNGDVPVYNHTVSAPYTPASRLTGNQQVYSYA